MNSSLETLVNCTDTGFFPQQKGTRRKKCNDRMPPKKRQRRSQGAKAGADVNTVPTDSGAVVNTEAADSGADVNTEPADSGANVNMEAADSCQELM